jgi:hypothetical protein
MIEPSEVVAAWPYVVDRSQADSSDGFQPLFAWSIMIIDSPVWSCRSPCQNSLIEMSKDRMGVAVRSQYGLPLRSAMVEYAP